MSFGNIVSGMLRQGMSSQTQDRLRSGASTAQNEGGIDGILRAFTGRSGSGQGGLADLAGDFLGREQAGGLTGAKIGGLGAALGGAMGGGLGGAARGGAMAILGTLAYKAWRDHSAGASAGASASEPPPETVEAMTSDGTERLAFRAMIGAAQADGRVDREELERILGRIDGQSVTEEERRAALEATERPVDVEAIGAEVSRPEVATEIYLAALMAVDVDTEAERDYFRRLARALRLDPGVVGRLHRMTGAPALDL